MTIHQRLSVVLGVMGLSYIVLFFLLLNAHGLSSIEQQQINRAVAQVLHAQSLRQSAQDGVSAVLGYLLTGDSRYRRKFSATRESIYSTLREWRGEIKRRDVGSGQPEPGHYKREALDKVSQLFDELERQLNRGQLDRDRASERRSRAQIESARDELDVLLQWIISEEQQALQRLAVKSDAQRQRLSLTLLISLILSSAVSLLLTERIRRGIASGIHELLNAAAAFAARRYDHAIPHLTGELETLGQTLTAMARRLQVTTIDQWHLEAVFDSIADMVVVLDTHGRVRSVNKQTTRITGYDELELIGHRVMILLPPFRTSHGAQAKALIQSLMASSRVGDRELMIRAKSGELIPVAISAAWITDRGEGRTGLVTTARDRRETLGLQLKEARASAEAAEAREIRIRAEEAEKASQVKSEFLARMSHEIRTPMNGVLGMAELLLLNELTPKQREFAESIQSSAEGLLTIINDILDFSKIEAGKLRLAEEDFDPREVVENTARLLARQAQAKGIELLCDLPEAFPPALRGDPHRLQQLLTNLLGNAIKFTEQGEVTVRGKVGENSETMIELRFEVWDTGIGIPQELQQHIFEAFTQSEQFNQRRHGGTGLGLAISHQLVGLMGGEIGLQSELGQGSMFWFTVTFKPPQVTPKPRVEPIAQLARKRVLLLESNAVNRLILSERLEAWRIEVIAGEHPGEIETLVEREFRAGRELDLLLLDEQTAHSEALELARRNDARTRRLPTIVMCAVDNVRNPSLSDRLELTRPVKRSELLDALLTGLGQPTLVDVNPDYVRSSESLGLKVLLAEDNPINQVVAEEMLLALECQVRIVPNGREAVNAVEREAFDLVLMDVQMPEMNGYEATRALRAREQAQGLPHLPIIALTANAMAGDRERALALGMDEYLSKPFTKDTLAKVLLQWATKAR